MLALRDGLTRPQSCAVGAESVKDGTGWDPRRPGLRRHPVRARGSTGGPVTRQSGNALHHGCYALLALTLRLAADGVVADDGFRDGVAEAHQVLVDDIVLDTESAEGVVGDRKLAADGRLADLHRPVGNVSIVDGDIAADQGLEQKDAPCREAESTLRR